MSIIRQRRKNLIVSGLLGFMIGTLMLTVLGFLFKAPLAELAGVIPEPIVIEPERTPAIVASRPIAKGTVLDRDDVVVIMVETDTKVTDHYTEPGELIGKKTTMDIDKNMPMTPPMFIEAAMLDNEDRLYEVSFVELPYHLLAGEQVDVRIAFPTGQEYVVLAKKTIKGFERREDNVHSGLLSLALKEEEALRMSSALVDKYIAEGTRVYLAKYVDPDNQVAAEVTYPVNTNVLELLKNNPNILERHDPEAILASRSHLDTAISDLMDAYNNPVHDVDMTTPTMSNAQTDMSDTAPEAVTDGQPRREAEPEEVNSAEADF